MCLGIFLCNFLSVILSVIDSDFYWFKEMKFSEMRELEFLTKYSIWIFRIR